jgi:hypothetical protein
MRGRRYHIAMHNQRGARIKISPLHLVGDASDQQVVDSEMTRFGHSPRRDELAPNAVLELPVSLQHQNVGALGCHGPGQGRTA